MKSVYILKFVVVLLAINVVKSEFENLLENHIVIKVVEKSLRQLQHFKHVGERSEDIYRDFAVLKENGSYSYVNVPAKFQSLNLKGSHCLRDIWSIFKNLLSKDGMWAIKMLDANGKLDSGVLQGNFKWVGEFDECRNVASPLGFSGSYCTMGISLNLGNNTLPISLGVCLPDTCNSQELSEEYRKVLKILNKIPFVGKLDSLVNITSLTCQPKTKSLTGGGIAVICIMAFLIFLALIGTSMTVIEHYWRSFKKTKTDDECVCDERAADENPTAVNAEVGSKHAGSGELNDVLLGKKSHNELLVFYERVKPFFNCFCVLTNGAKLLNTDSTEGQLMCLHGIRFLSMTWVILCHCYMFSFTTVKNLLDAMTLLDSWKFQVVLNGFFSVDSFFLLSGFLLSYLYFVEAKKKNGKIPWVYFYLHRYLRLTPVYMLMLGFATTLYMNIGSGPFWPVQNVEPICEKYWWTNLLYINNFFDSHQCFGHSWYLANDMQFFIISPFILVSLFRWPKVGYTLLGLLFSATIVANIVITYEFNLIAGYTKVVGMTDEAGRSVYTDWFNYIYIKPYTRIGPYLVGIILGYILYKRKENLNPKSLNWITLICGWIIASTVTLTCQYGLFHRDPPVIAAGMYNALTRSLFGAGLGWVIFVCLIGQGGPVNSILSYKLFIPLSRLTYCAYLIHPMIVTGYFTNLKTPLEFSHVVIVIVFLGLLVVTYAFSLIVSVLFESPVIRLEKFIRSKFSSS